MSFVVGIIENVFLNSILSILYFPIWWYTIGAKKRVLGFVNGIKKQIHDLALKTMFKYLFKPMYGETSFSGRVISFFMRLILLIWRLFLFLIVVVFSLAMLLLWLFLPLVVLWQMIIQFNLGL